MNELRRTELLPAGYRLPTYQPALATGVSEQTQSSEGCLPQFCRPIANANCINCTNCISIHSFIQSINHSYIQTFIHSYSQSFIHSYSHSFIHIFIQSFIHLFIRSFMRLLLVPSATQIPTLWPSERTQARTLLAEGRYLYLPNLT